MSVGAVCVFAATRVVGTPLDVTVGMGGQCTSGTLTLRQKSAKRAVFPSGRSERPKRLAE